MHRTMILSNTIDQRRARAGTELVATPLDAIVRLDARPPIQTLVLAGAYRQLAASLGELYPSIRIEEE